MTDERRKEIRNALNELQKWAEENELEEMQIRRAVHQLFPSFCMTKDTQYNGYYRNGYQSAYFETFPKNAESFEDRFSVKFYEYDSFWDQNSSEPNFYSIN